jgi:anaerobic glycerol-3-phosphate dehydrogenase
MNELFSHSEVVIIGGGFSGMNAARILCQNGISSTIISDGHGASHFWNGTIDVLNYPGDNLDLELAKFQVSLPNHPYAKMNQQKIYESLLDLSKTLDYFQIFENEGKIANKYVLTPLGTTKLCAGIWNSLFIDYDKLESDSLCLLIEFEGFPASTAPLICLGLEEKFQGEFLTITISFTDLLNSFGSKLENSSEFNDLTAKKIATFLDSHTDELSPLVSLLTSKLKEKYPEKSLDDLTHILFAPLMGLDHTIAILKNLTTLSKCLCFEYLTYSPSVLADRFISKMERKSELLMVSMKKNQIFSDFRWDEGSKKWISIVQDPNGDVIEIHSKYLIFACGSLIPQGLFSDRMKVANEFLSQRLDYPESINNVFEVISSRDYTNLFVIGSALFNFSTNLSEEDEIQDGTGLGLGIATSYKVAHVIINREKEE